MREDETRSRGLAKALRGRLTNAEAILWARLRRYERAHFRRQHPIGSYITDFACATARLVIEIDGATHSSELEKRHDEKRDAYLASEGWHVLRVSNVDVYENLEGVFQVIERWLPPPRPSAAFLSRSTPKKS